MRESTMEKKHFTAPTNRSKEDSPAAEPAASPVSKDILTDDQLADKMMNMMNVMRLTQQPPSLVLVLSRLKRHHELTGTKKGAKFVKSATSVIRSMRPSPALKTDNPTATPIGASATPIGASAAPKKRSKTDNPTATPIGASLAPTNTSAAVTGFLCFLRRREKNLSNPNNSIS